jgi:hypothetical protein
MQRTMMRSPECAFLAGLAFLAPGARGQLLVGDLVLSRFGTSAPVALDRYDSSGNLVWHLPATSTGQWLGAAITPRGAEQHDAVGRFRVHDLSTMRR